MVDEAGELRQSLGLGSECHIPQVREANTGLRTGTSTQYFCKMPQSSTAESRVQ